MADTPVKVDKVDKQVDAQVAQPREPDTAKVDVYEVSVATDEVITDPASDLAVQVPDAGKGDASVPAAAFVGAEHVEDKIADAASTPSEPSEEDRVKAAEEGKTATEVAAESK